MFTKSFKNQYKINKNDPKSGHKTAQDRPQTVPGRSCRGVFFGSFFALIFDRFLVRFWSALGPLLATIWRPKSIIFGIEISWIFACRSKSGPRAAMGGPRAAKGGTRAARRGPRATKSGPIAAQERPRAPQERPRAAKSGLERPKSGQERLLLSGSLSNKRCHKSAASAVRPLQ